MASAQDMPPPGGFGYINVERTYAKPLMRRSVFAILGLAASINGIFLSKEWKRRYRVIKAERAEHYIAAHPFLAAEQERKFLMRLRYLREEERELMKDHPGWQLGTLYGEPVYKTLPKGVLPPIHLSEFCQYRTQDEQIFKIVSPDWHQ